MYSDLIDWATDCASLDHTLEIFTLARNAPNLEIPDELLLKQQLLEEAWGFSSLADAPDEKAPQLRDEVMRILEECGF